MSTPPEVKKHLYDIITAIQDIEAYTRDIGEEKYLRHGMVQAAVERKFEIIGEALNRLQRTDPALLRQVSAYERIIGFRNILAHGYDIIDHGIVWAAIQNHLPTLKREVEHLLTPDAR